MKNLIIADIDMKKSSILMLYLASFIIVSGLCSCIGKQQPQVNEQAIKDSIAKAVEDSLFNAKESEEKLLFIERMYKDFFESGLIDDGNPRKMKQYVSKKVIKHLTAEGEYDGDNGVYYVYDFFRDGDPGLTRPDYGDKVVSRKVKQIDKDWFEVTNIWDVIDKPVIVKFKVEKVEDRYLVTDIADNHSLDIEFSKIN